MLDQINISVLKQDHNYGEIVVEPLPQGYGLTLGNALRRVLLTSLPGMAVTSVKITGVAHEYSSIEGVKEDVVQILLNLKRVRLSPETDKEIKTGDIKISLSEKGSKEVKAGDFKVIGPAKIANPELVVATLTSAKSKLDLEASVEYGSGYVPVEDRKAAGNGTIPLDAVYSPVMRVNYKVEATRVGQITNFDKLTIQVYTDGTITPEETIKSASRILGDYFGVLQGPYGVGASKKAPKNQSSSTKLANDAPIEELDLPTRVTNSLKTAGIETLGNLIETPREKIMALKNLGAKYFITIEEKLKEKGIAISE